MEPHIDEVELERLSITYFMSGSRRSVRLEDLARRAAIAETPVPVRNPRFVSASEPEEDLVVIPTQVAEAVLSPEERENPELRANPEVNLEDIDRRPDSVSSEGEESPDEAIVMVNSTRLRYSRFRGDGSKDVDDWMGEFDATAVANQEDLASRQRIFQGLLRGEALKWYQDVPEVIRNNWDRLTDHFLRTFREAGGEARALGRLSKVTMRSSESVRKYGQRVKALIQKLTTEVSPSIQVEWYVAGFPEDMGFQIRQSRPATLREAMETAQNWENSTQSMRRSIEKSEKKEKGRSKKYERKERRRRKFSDSETSSSDTRSDSSNTDSGSSSSEAETSSSRKATKSRREKADKRTVKVKVEDDDSKKMMKSIQESLEAIKVNLADNRKPRRIIPTTRANVWCTKCGGPGHYASECPHGPQKQIHYVDEEGVYYTLPEPETYEEINPVYQIQTGYGRGKAPQQLIRTTMIPQAVGSSQGNFPPPRFPHGCCYICGGPDHYADRCPHRGLGQGAPLPLPCQNCGKYGHPITGCPEPQQVRTVYKQVEVPPRDQTALNYGSKTGIENTDK